jgi:hypothetical protein
MGKITIWGEMTHEVQANKPDQWFVCVEFNHHMHKVGAPLHVPKAHVNPR